LDACLAPEIDGRDLERRIAEVEAIGCPTSNLAHTNLADPGMTERQCFLDGADHHDT
jgi:hypothetical protein